MGIIINKKIMAFISASCMICSCATTNTGTFGVGNPTALPPKQSMDSLKEYAKYMQTRMSVKASKDSEIEDLDPLKTNRISRIEYAKAFKGALAATPGASTPPTAPDNATILPVVDKVTLLETSDKPSGLLMDKISTLEAFAAHKQRMNDLSCLYEETKDTLYKVLFTIWIEPERQNAWQYAWRWLDLMNGFKNYTKDYHADIMFNILNGKDSLPIRIVRLEPEHEGSISDEYYSLMSQSQLGLAATWQEIAAKTDLAERLRQAEVEQRKYPIIRSIIETQSDEHKQADFHFIISPRQHVEERTFRIPFFMSPYTMTRRLESVPYNVAAYFLVPSSDKLNELEKELKLEVTACYKEYGQPERRCEFNFIKTYDKYNHRFNNSDFDYRKIELSIKLPKTPNPIKDAEKCSVGNLPPKPTPEPNPQVTETDETQTTKSGKTGSLTHKHTVVKQTK